MLFFDASYFHIMDYKILIAVRLKYLNKQICYFASILDKSNTEL
jgi:hypothetical protein